MLAMRRQHALNTSNHQDRIYKAISPAYEDMLSSLCLDSAKISKEELGIPAFTEKFYGKDYKWNKHRLRRLTKCRKFERIMTFQYQGVRSDCNSV